MAMKFVSLWYISQDGQAISSSMYFFTVFATSYRCTYYYLNLKKQLAYENRELESHIVIWENILVSFPR